MTNILYLEQLKAHQIYSQIVLMSKTGLIKRGHQLDSIKLDMHKPDGNFPATTLYDRSLTIGGKQISHEMIHAIVSRKFHACLKKEASSNDTKALYFSYSDYDLIHKVCRKERLTLYNFMKMHMADENRTQTIE